jgi:hypothetical protein
MKTMLIITGPQGSGNHVFSKVLALHKSVYGWRDLLNKYWIAHDFEPFSECWDMPNLLYSIDWSACDYHVTSISCPYANQGVVTIPKYKEFINTLKDFDIDVKIAIIGRDQNVLKYQQERVRDRYSYPDFEKELDYLNTLDPIYISQELLYLYKDKYLKSLSKQLDFPIAYDDPRVFEILENDANEKYFNKIERQELDSLVRKVSGIKETV